MKPKSKTLFAFLSLLLVVNLACGGLTPAATATPVPTNTAIPTNTPQPVATPITLFVDGTAEDALDETIFKHASGAFEFNAPKGWTIEEFDNDVFIQSPESVFFYLSVTNTGYKLTPSEFSRYIQNSEDFFYGYREGYKELNRVKDESIDLELIDKTYSLENGSTAFVSSIYQQFDQVIYTVELYGDLDEILGNPSYEQVFNAFYQSLLVHSKTAATLPIYGLSWSYQTNDQAYTLNMPQGWEYEYYEITAGFTSQYQLISPDGHAVINVFEDAGNSLATDIKSLDEFSLLLLNANYSNGTNDIKIVTKGEESNGIFYEWTSPSNAYSGFAYILEKTNSAEPVLLTIFWENDYDYLYRQLGADIINSLLIN